MSTDIMENLVSLCKRRGFIFQSSEIYGGINSCYDYGPLGVELKRNIKNYWWSSMVNMRDNVVGLDSSILMAPRVWHASGHVEEFSDPLVDCKKCKSRFREDQLPSDSAGSCPRCSGELTDARNFNLMFKTFMGPVEEDAAVVYLRPETAQGIYVNFVNVAQSMRQKVPFGIAQIGKAFRNEITPGNFIFRTREFEQMEMQFFVHESEAADWLEKWKKERLRWYGDLGINPSSLHVHEHGADELAHYAKKAYDIQFEFPFGLHELEGLHNRGNFDLTRHAEYSGKNLTYFDEARNEKYLPYVIETSAGCDRTLLALLTHAYKEEEDRVVLKLSPKIAPVKAAVLPLVKKDGLAGLARDLFKALRGSHALQYDEGGSIGRRYRRQDEIGTPFCITVDTQTKEDQTVTWRDRDTMEQTRLPINEVATRLHNEVHQV